MSNKTDDWSVGKYGCHAETSTASKFSIIPFYPVRAVRNCLINERYYLSTRERVFVRVHRRKLIKNSFVVKN